MSLDSSGRQPDCRARQLLGRERDRQTLGADVIQFVNDVVDMRLVRENLAAVPQRQRHRLSVRLLNGPHLASLRRDAHRGKRSRDTLSEPTRRSPVASSQEKR